MKTSKIVLRGAQTVIRNLLFSLLFFCFQPSAFSSQKEEVDLMLVLAVDVSYSVDKSEYELQKKGIMDALKDNEIGLMVEQCTQNGIALSYVEWAGKNEKEEVKLVMPWRKLNSREQLKTFASELEKSRRSFHDGSTDLIRALRFSANLLHTAPFRSARMMIDISGDGKQNVTENTDYDHYESMEVHAARLQLTARSLFAQNIIINALAIGEGREMSENLANQKPHEHLADYFERFLRGGNGSFVVPIEGYEDYSRNFRLKLRHELNQCYG